MSQPATRMPVDTSVWSRVGNRPEVATAMNAWLAAGVPHYDAEYDHIAGITGRPTEWIVPRGSVS